MPVRFTLLMTLALALFAGGCSLIGYESGTSQVSSSIRIAVPPQSQTDAALEHVVERKNLVDYIVVQKKDHIVSLWNRGRLIQTFPIMALGAQPTGHKMFEGDERTPEGLYTIDEMHVSKQFQKFLNISYPNDQDLKNAQKYGRSAGGHVGFHGDRGGFQGFMQRFDKGWTDGCIALRNADIEKMFAMVDVGTPVLIKP